MKISSTILLACTVLNACASPQKHESLAPNSAQMRHQLPDTRYSPNGALSVSLKYTDAFGVYYIIDRKSGKVIGSAISAMGPGDLCKDGSYRGSENVVFAPDNSALCIQEGLGDGIPAARYIFVARNQDGTYYPSYLKISATAPVEKKFREQPEYYDFPNVAAVSHDSISLYRNSKRPILIPIDRIDSSDSPQDAPLMDN